MSIVKKFESTTGGGNRRIGIKAKGSKGQKVLDRMISKEDYKTGKDNLAPSAKKDALSILETNSRSITRKQERWIDSLIDLINSYYKKNSKGPSKSTIKGEIGSLPPYDEKKSKSKSRSKSKSKSKSKSRKNKSESDSSSSESDSSSSESDSSSSESDSSSSDSGSSSSEEKSKKKKTKVSPVRKSSKTKTSPVKKSSKTKTSPVKKSSKTKVSPARKASKEKVRVSEEKNEQTNSFKQGDYLVQFDYSDNDPYYLGVFCNNVIAKNDEFEFSDSFRSKKIVDYVKDIHTFYDVVTGFTSKNNRNVVRKGGNFFIGDNKVTFTNNSKKSYTLPEIGDKEKDSVALRGDYSINKLYDDNIQFNVFSVNFPSSPQVGKIIRISSESGYIDRVITKVTKNSLDFPYALMYKNHPKGKTLLTEFDSRTGSYPGTRLVNNTFPDRIEINTYYSKFTDDFIYFAYMLCIPEGFEVEISKWGVINRIYNDDESYPVYENMYFEDKNILFNFIETPNNTSLVKGYLTTDEVESDFSAAALIEYKGTKSRRIKYVTIDYNNATVIACLSVISNKKLKIGTLVEFEDKTIETNLDFLTDSYLPFHNEDGVDYVDLLEKGNYSNKDVITGYEEPTSSDDVEEDESDEEDESGDDLSSEDEEDVDVEEENDLDVSE